MRLTQESDGVVVTTGLFTKDGRTEAKIVDIKGKRVPAGIVRECGHRHRKEVSALHCSIHLGRAALTKMGA